MRGFVKIFLSLLWIFAICISYKVVAMDGKFQTAFNDYNFNRSEMTATDALKVITDIKEVYHYNSFNKDVYVYQTDKYGLIFLGNDEEDNKNAFVNKLLSIVSMREVKEIKPISWYFGLAVLIFIIGFPHFKKVTAEGKTKISAGAIVFVVVMAIIIALMVIAYYQPFTVIYLGAPPR